MAAAAVQSSSMNCDSEEGFRQSPVGTEESAPGARKNRIDATTSKGDSSFTIEARTPNNLLVSSDVEPLIEKFGQRLTLEESSETSGNEPDNGFRHEPEGELGGIEAAGQPLGRVVTGMQDLISKGMKKNYSGNNSDGSTSSHPVFSYYPEGHHPSSEKTESEKGTSEAEERKQRSLSAFSISSYQKLPVNQQHENKGWHSEPGNLQEERVGDTTNRLPQKISTEPNSARIANLAAFYKSIGERQRKADSENFHQFSDDLPSQTYSHNIAYHGKFTSTQHQTETLSAPVHHFHPFSRRQGSISDTTDRTGASSVVSDHSSVSNYSRKTAEIITEATLPGGEVDYEKLRRLLHDERSAFKDRLEKEKAKRIALEELLVKYGRKKRRERADRRKEKREKQDTSGRSTSSSVSSVDTSDLLLELVRHHLKKGRRSSQSNGYSTLEESSLDRTLSAKSAQEQKEENKENYYESTSLFSLLPTDRDKEAADQVPVHPRSYQNSGAQTSGMPVNPPVVQLGRGFEAEGKLAFDPKPQVPMKDRSTGLKSSKWWWVTADGKVSQKMPPYLKHTLEAKHPQFLKRSRSRQMKIAKASYFRKELNSRLRMLAEEVAAGQLTVSEATEIATNAGLSREPSAFPLKEMRQRTKEKYLRLPEYQKKQQQLQRQMEGTTNRICAQMYKQRITYQVITKGNANIS